MKKLHVVSRILPMLLGARRLGKREQERNCGDSDRHAGSRA